MYQTLKRLYQSGELTAAKLMNAVKKKWITKEDADEIKGARGDN